MEKQALVKEIRTSKSGKAKYIDIEFAIEREGFESKPIQTTLEVYNSLVQDSDWISEGDVILAIWKHRESDGSESDVFQGALPQKLAASSKKKPKTA